MVLTMPSSPPALLIPDSEAVSSPKTLNMSPSVFIFATPAGLNIALSLVALFIASTTSLSISFLNNASLIFVIIFTTSSTVPPSGITLAMTLNEAVKSPKTLNMSPSAFIFSMPSGPNIPSTSVADFIAPTIDLNTFFSLPNNSLLIFEIIFTRSSTVPSSGIRPTMSLNEEAN